jgi:putrescine transport system permease protein
MDLPVSDRPSLLLRRLHALGRGWGRWSVIGIPFLVLLLLSCAPFLVVLKLSVADTDGLHYLDLATWHDGLLTVRLRLSNYLFLVSDSLYVRTYASSLRFAALNTGLCLLIGYPFAYFMARSPARLRPALVMLVSLPFWTSFLLRVYAWKGLLDDSGVINNTLLWLHLIDHPIVMMHTGFSMTVGMVYSYLPFMILPLYAVLVKMDMRLLEAAKDLGATPFEAFCLVTVPLSARGIFSGALLVFIPSVGEYVIPELLGGPDTLMIGRVLWDEFFSNNDWGMASTVAVSMMLMLLVPLAVFTNMRAEGSAKRGA